MIAMQPYQRRPPHVFLCEIVKTFIFLFLHRLEYQVLYLPPIALFLLSILLKGMECADMLHIIIKALRH